MTTEPLPQGSIVGILGGGQLGRMLSLAASRLGMKTHVYCPDPDSPAFDVTPLRTIAGYDDQDALLAFSRAVDVITYEFENVPAETARILAAQRPLHPGVPPLAVAQDRLAEKQFLLAQGVPVAPFRPVTALDDLQAGLLELGLPAVLKTTRMGYDGKGQQVIRRSEEAEAAFRALMPKPLVLEAFVPFVREISVVIARNARGETARYEAAENVHREGVLRTSTVPAAISLEVAGQAGDVAERLVSALDYVGVLGIEFFVTADDGLLVNEIAPRVHNSGHWTEAVCLVDQFEQHIRAVLNWPLGETRRWADVTMRNLIGDEVAAVPAGLGAYTRPHLYGKAEVRAGRKMGHLNIIAAPIAAK